MCLSTVYKDQKDEASVIMKNVMTITCQEGSVTLTDLMERSVTIEGTLERADLVDGFVIIKTK